MVEYPTPNLPDSGSDSKGEQAQILGGYVAAAEALGATCLGAMTLPMEITRGAGVFAAPFFYCGAL